MYSTEKSFLIKKKSFLKNIESSSSNELRQTSNTTILNNESFDRNVSQELARLIESKFFVDTYL